MVSKCAVGNVIIDQKQTSRIAAVPVKLNKIWVINRGQNQDFVAERFSGEGFVAIVVFTVKVLNGDDSAVKQLAQVNGSKASVADFALRVELISGRFELFVGEHWREKTC